LKFNSTSELPSNVQQILGKEANMVGMFLKPRNNDWAEEDLKTFECLMDCMAGSATAHIVVPGIAHVKVCLRGTKFSSSWKHTLEQ